MVSINPPGPSGQTSTTAPRDAGWRDGQLLKALVVGEAKAPGQVATLQIGRLTVPVLPQQLNLSRGMELLLQVIRRQDGLALKLLEAPSNQPAKRPALIEQYFSQIRNLAPRQEGPSRLFAVLQAVARAPDSAQIPRDLRQLARQAVAEIPDARQTREPAALRRMVESMSAPPLPLAAPTSQGETRALRQLIAHLLALLKPGTADSDRTTGFQPPLPTRLGPPSPQVRWTPPELPQLNASRLLIELLAAARGSEARQQLQQLAGLEAASAGENRWHIEFPVRFENGVDIVSLVIQRESRHGTNREQAAQWSATLALSLPELGGIQARLAIQGARVSIDIHVEEHATLANVQEQLPRLRAALERRQLEVQQISARLGKIEDDVTVSGSQLLDVRA